MDELDLIHAITDASSQDERDTLISQLESLPVDWHPYYLRWLRIHAPDPFEGWTETGYDPSLSPLPRDVQLLAAARYGTSDIENGGFDQFFTNVTGVFAPEMMEWFERAGLQRAASILTEAVEVFGPRFPRGQEERQEFLGQFQGETRAEWDPFYHLHEPFFDCVTRSSEGFDAAADKWLREICGFDRLSKRPTAERNVDDNS